MNILKLHKSLPPLLPPYMGYIFQLQVRGDFVGYWLFMCVSKNRKKKEAFKQGYWIEEKRVVVDSVGSDYLFKAFIFNETDKDYYYALESLYNLLLKERIIIIESEQSLNYQNQKLLL